MAHLLFAHDLPCRPVMVGWRWGAQETSDGGFVRRDTPRVRVRPSQYFRGGTQVRRASPHGARGDRELNPDAAASQGAAAANDRAAGRVHRRDSGRRSASAAQTAAYSASDLGADYARAVEPSDRRVDGASVRAAAQAGAGAARRARGVRATAVRLG